MIQVICMIWAGCGFQVGLGRSRQPSRPAQPPSRQPGRPAAQPPSRPAAHPPSRRTAQPASGPAAKPAIRWGGHLPMQPEPGNRKLPELAFF